MSIGIDVKTAKTGFWHFPKAFYAVLFIEFWERFAFYGLQSVAVLYFIQKFGIKESAAGDLFASFSAMLYAMLTIGGAVGDKVLGLRRTYLLGIVFLIAGYGLVSLAQTTSIMYFAMGIILVGNIFFKTNANNYVGRCFESNDPRLDSAFTYFYMSINIGSFSSLVLVPVIAQMFNYHVGLSALSIAMMIALFSYFLLRSRFANADNQVGKNGHNMFLKFIIVIVVALIASLLFSFLLRDLAVCKIAFYFIAAITVVVYLLIASRMNHKEAKGMYIALLLILLAIVFFVLYIQASTSMTLFALHNVRLTFLGYTVPAGVTQSLNPFFVIFFSPILANLYIKLHKSKINYTIPAKFVTGILLAGLCFVSLGVGAQFFADASGQVSVVWMVLAYALYSAGELLVSALGASMVTQLLPKRMGGFAQGMWYLGQGFGMKVGGQLSVFVATDYVASSDPQVLLHSYLNFFYQLGGAVVIIAFALSFAIKSLSKSMESVLGSKY